ncbi:MAG: alpha-1,2-fucosyltransferase, partial [Pseudomonadota bacterium]|nr:alpha-1,2-fucosyltransferase [Pseudomonadota bacterium]
MFQYAAGYAYARHHNKKQVLFNKTHELIKPFNIKNEVIYQPIKHNIFDESDGENHLRDFINTPGFDFLTGYFQDGKLFQEYREELLNIFQFKNNPGEQNERYAHHIKNTNSVSVHIRRTDYLIEFPKSVLPATYY